jgi:hypothetical protein
VGVVFILWAESVGLERTWLNSKVRQRQQQQQPTIFFVSAPLKQPN